METNIKKMLGDIERFFMLLNPIFLVIPHVKNLKICLFTAPPRRLQHIDKTTLINIHIIIVKLRFFVKYCEIVVYSVANAYPGRANLFRGIRSFVVQHQHVSVAVASVKKIPGYDRHKWRTVGHIFSARPKTVIFPNLCVRLKL